MKLQICSIYDQVAQIHKQPFFFRNTAQAERAFAGEANREESEIAANPADYSLHHIGEFDEESGTIVGFDNPKSLGLAVKYVKPSVPSPG